MTRRRVTDEQYGQLCRRLREVERRVLEGSIDFETTMNSLQEKIIEGQFLKLVSSGEFIIDSVDGEEVLREANDVFAYIHPDLMNYIEERMYWGERGLRTKETPVRVYETIGHTNPLEMFCSLRLNAKYLCFTQAQIKSFVKKYFDWSKGNNATLFYTAHNGI